MQIQDALRVITFSCGLGNKLMRAQPWAFDAQIVTAVNLKTIWHFYESNQVLLPFPQQLMRARPEGYSDASALSLKPPKQLQNLIRSERKPPSCLQLSVQPLRCVLPLVRALLGHVAAGMLIKRIWTFLAVLCSP